MRIEIEGGGVRVCLEAESTAMGLAEALALFDHAHGLVGPARLEANVSGFQFEQADEGRNETLPGGTGYGRYGE